jgi:PAS domain S-box-containing protein
MKSRIAPLSVLAELVISGIDLALLEQLFDLVPEVAFFVKDSHGRYLSVNQSLVTRHGLKKKTEAIGKTPHEICAGEFGRVPTEQDRAVLTTGRPLIDHMEFQWHSPHEPVWCLTTKLPIRDAAGDIVGIIGFSRDVRVMIGPGEVPRGFASALEELETRLPPEANPAWLARRAKLTPQRLARLTRRVFDLTPGQLITKTRMMAASRLLVDTSMTVAEIAHASGFYDHSAFSRAFRSATGFTPSEFRMQWVAIDGAAE